MLHPGVVEIAVAKDVIRKHSRSSLLLICRRKNLYLFCSNDSPLENKKDDPSQQNGDTTKINHLLEQRWKLRDIPVSEKMHYGKLLIRWIIPIALIVIMLSLALEMGLGSILVTFFIYMTIGYIFILLVYVLMTGTSISDSVSRSLRRSRLIKYRKR